jgi:hypothetical protein
MDYDSAVKDYSSAIGLKFGPMVIVMSIPAIRSIYPELSDMSDQDLVEALRQKYYPQMDDQSFYKTLQKNEPQPISVLADLYRSRGDTYTNAGDTKRATAEYTRAQAITGTR